jgi:hypothetical protein
VKTLDNFNDYVILELLQGKEIDMQEWTQDEAIDYECAREVITDLRAILISQIYEESKKPQPDAELVERWEAESQRLFRERANLHVHNHVEIARIHAEYGARIRAWRAESQDIKQATPA